ncbi:hypothetical protein ACIQFZ_31375 [Streptomyces sp. NPDC093064]|uniref:hypothetical protein n=1 Tax=unclassified Streptomyces TaxID=2593676 RepID=UPI0036A4A358
MTTLAVPTATRAARATAEHRVLTARGPAAPLSGGVRRPDRAAGVLPHAHAAGGGGDGGDRGGETDGYVQGAHGQPPPG